MTITKNGLEYRATSLEDIAAEFDRLAADLKSDHLREDHTDGQAEGLQKAAVILRATKLEAPGIPMFRLGQIEPIGYAMPDGRIIKVTTQNTDACNHQWVTTAEGTTPCPKCGMPCPD